MALNNKLKPIVDLPVWEWMRYLPFTTAATNTFITTQAGDTGSWQNRYIYALNSTDQWRYDTYSDSWSYMGTMYPNLPASTVTGVWKKDDGYVSRFISAASGSYTATGAFMDEHAVVGMKIKVVSGPGRGTVRTIVGCTSPQVADEFLISEQDGNALPSGPTSFGANWPNRKWEANKWSGYQLKVHRGVGAQYIVRPVLGNSTDRVFIAWPQWHVSDPQLAYNVVIDSNRIMPTTNASTNLSYTTKAQIEYMTITVDEPWPVSMDHSSRFEIESGMLHSVQNVSTQAFYLHYMYDPLMAAWKFGRNQQGIVPSYLAATELQLESIDGSLTPPLVSSSLTSGSTRTAMDTTQNWERNQWANYRFINKTSGYERAIISNDQTTLYFGQDLDFPPSGSDAYQIMHDSDKLYMNGGNNSSMAQYSCRTNTWLPSQRYDEGILNRGYVRFSSSYESMYMISSITRTGPIMTVTLANSGPFKNGDRVFISGALGADSIYYNGFTTVKYDNTQLYPFSPIPANQFSYTASGAPTPTANAVLQSLSSNTVMYDVSKNWAINELTGKIAMVYEGITGVLSTPQTQYRRIIANSSQSFTVDSAFTLTFPPPGGNPDSAYGYAILNTASFGADWSYDNTNREYGSSSWSITGSSVAGTSFLVFSASYLPILEQIPTQCPIFSTAIYSSGNTQRTQGSLIGQGTSFISMSININSSFTANNTVINFNLSSVRGFGSASAGGSSTLTDSSRRWQAGQHVNARLRILAGTGAGLESTVTQNDVTTLTISPTITTDTTSVYSIIPIGVRNTTSTTVGAGGADMKWVYGTAQPALHPSSSLGKYIWCFEAGATMRLQKYNIATMQYEFPFIAPFNHMTGENLTTGTMYAYDGKGRIYIQPNATARIIYIDTDRDRSEVGGQIPAGMSTARQGRRFWVKKTEDGLDYLYIARHNDTPFWRQLMTF